MNKFAVCVFLVIGRSNDNSSPLHPKYISPIKKIGNATLTCAARAKTKDTLMMAIEDLQECLFQYYQECASEYATPATCDARVTTLKPCGTYRFGVHGETGEAMTQYEPYQVITLYI